MLRNEISFKIKQTEGKYNTKEANECSDDPTKLWTFLNKVVKTKDHTHPPSEISANDFNTYFSSIGQNTADSLPKINGGTPWKGPKSNTTFTFQSIEIKDITKMLKKLAGLKSVDVLGFDAYLLFLGSDIIAPFLTKLFNASLNTSIVPDDWKTARVTPVYKGKGDKSEKGNYRPISVIGHLAKLLEREIQRQLMTYLIKNNLISIDQSAYRKFHNTQTSLHRVTDDWIDNICDNLDTGICFLDIKKCFDTIDHDILIEKLSFYGIVDVESSWFKSYLSNRALIVKCNGKLLNERYVNIGVPQGSVLGPTLFMIYANDLSQHIHIGMTNLYADDALIYCTAPTIPSLKTKLQKCVDDVCVWYNGNKFGINATKSNTKVIASNNLSKVS